MDLAVIKTGGKQYLVSPGQKIKIEKIEKKEGSEIIFNEVLLLKKGEKIEIGRPLIKEAKVRGKILKHGKGKKITVLKYKPKTRYKVKRGHRQPFSEVEILKIESKVENS
jgi:large subunit ribosomal protein L21